MAEGLLKMYVEDPDLFWQFIYGIAPGFIACLLYGLLLQSRDLNGRTTSGWKMFRFVALVNVASLSWIGYLTNWSFANMTNEEAVFSVGLYALVLMFPLCYGAMTGMWLLRVYWFVKRTVHRYRPSGPRT
jgi:hypothetical protein